MRSALLHGSKTGIRAVWIRPGDPLSRSKRRHNLQCHGKRDLDSSADIGSTYENGRSNDGGEQGASDGDRATDELEGVLRLTVQEAKPDTATTRQFLK